MNCIIMSEYFKRFIIGSSYGIFIIPMLMAFSLDQEKRRYTDGQYALIAPLYFGLMNSFSLWLAKTFNLDLKIRMFVTSIISIIIVLLWVRINKIYKFDNREWMKYYIIIILMHLFIFNVIIYHTEKLFKFDP